MTSDGELYYLNLPSRHASKAELPNQIKLALSHQPQQIFKSRDYLLVYKNEEQIKQLEINRALFDKINLGQGGLLLLQKELIMTLFLDFSPHKPLF